MDLPTQTWTLAGALASEDRDAVAKFWISAPQDQLEVLWGGPLGDLTKNLVRRLSPEIVLPPHQVAIRESLGDWFNQNGLNHSLAPQLMLANFLYSPSGLLKINSPEQHFPAWLVLSYRELYEVSAAPNADQSAVHQPLVNTTLEPQGQQSIGNSPSSTENDIPSSIPTPDFGEFPNSLEELADNRIQLNRILGLSNLYYIDPEDQEIVQELVDLRRDFVAAINRCPENKLQQLWTTEIGDRYWAMVRSGVQKENLNEFDEELKQAATKTLTPSLGGPGFGGQGALNAFLVSMLFYLPGTMKVDNPEQKLPEWLFSQYEQIFAQSIST